MKIRLIHWNRGEALERAERLKALGHTVTASWKEGGEGYRAIQKSPPDAVVIDLSRLPSHGRQMGIALREKKTTRGIPIVFLGGEKEKVDRVREALPDAIFASWRGLKGALTKASRGGPKDPVVPKSQAGYSGTPLPKKLGVTDGKTLTLLAAPDDVEKGLAQAGLAIRKRLGAKAEVILLFVKKRTELDKKLGGAVKALERGGGLWLAWPKKTSGLATDLDREVIREMGLATGLVDNKVCAIDEKWSGLRFVHRRSK